MSEQVKKTPCSIALLAMFVQADENHTQKRKSPVRKPGIFHALGGKTILGDKNTTICCCFIVTETAAYGG